MVLVLAQFVMTGVLRYRNEAKRVERSMKEPRLEQVKELQLRMAL